LGAGGTIVFLLTGGGFAALARWAFAVRSATALALSGVKASTLNVSATFCGVATIVLIAGAGTGTVVVLTIVGAFCALAVADSSETVVTLVLPRTGARAC
jgi:uncharacterized ferredoxin-like protein